MRPALLAAAAAVPCAACGDACVPMADHDVPTCFRCDDVIEAIKQRAAAMPADYPKARKMMKEPA